MTKADYQVYQVMKDPLRFVSKRQGIAFFIIVLVLGIFSRIFVTSVIHTNLDHITKERADIESTVPPAHQQDLSYAIMGDMGSSGSRVYVYSYKRITNPSRISCALGEHGEFEKLALVEGFEDKIRDKPLNEKKPGIDSLSKMSPPYNADEYFSGLIKFAKSMIPEEKHSETPFFMYATAGLRVLAENNQEKIFDDDEFDYDLVLEDDDEFFGVGVVAEILRAVRSSLKQSPFIFEDNHVRILSGEEEAVYDWQSLQQLLHNGERTMTKENNQILEVDNAENGAFAVGIIDTGGASSQIAYLPQYSFEGNAKTKVFENHENRIIARSFLGYGMYKSRSILEGRVIKQCLDDPLCDSDYIVNPCFSYNNTQHNNFDGKKYDIHGGGNFEECYKEVLAIFDLPGCEAEVCGIHGIALPEPKKGTKFLAIDNANRAASFFGFQGPSSLIELEESVKLFCSTEWNEAMKIYGPRSNEFRIKKYCYEGVYLLVLLHHGYQFPMNTDSIIFTDYVGAVHVNWPLGAMASDLNALCISGQI